MSRKVLVMGKHMIEKSHWGVIRTLLGMEPSDKSKIEIVNVPVTHILDDAQVKEYGLIISAQTNPIVLRRVSEIAKRANVKLVKPFRNSKKELSHLMVIKNVIVDFDHELVELPTVKKEEVKIEKKQFVKKPYVKKENNFKKRNSK